MVSVAVPLSVAPCLAGGQCVRTGTGPTDYYCCCPTGKGLFTLNESDVTNAMSTVVFYGII